MADVPADLLDRVDQHPAQGRRHSAEIWVLADNIQRRGGDDLCARCRSSHPTSWVRPLVGNEGRTYARRRLATLLYPLGFIVVIVGRAQLFTENTLFPVVLVLDRRRHLGNTLRLWAVVLTANVAGALLFAVLMIKAGAVSAEVAGALSRLGIKTVQGGSVTSSGRAWPVAGSSR